MFAGEGTGKGHGRTAAVTTLVPSSSEHFRERWSAREEAQISPHPLDAVGIEACVSRNV